MAKYTLKSKILTKGKSMYHKWGVKKGRTFVPMTYKLKTCQIMAGAKSSGLKAFRRSNYNFMQLFFHKILLHTIRKRKKMAGQNTFQILFFNDANMLGEH